MTTKVKPTDVTESANVEQVKPSPLGNAVHTEQTIEAQLTDDLTVSHVLSLIDLDMKGQTTNIVLGEYYTKLTGRGKAGRGECSDETFEAAIEKIIKTSNSIYNKGLVMPNASMSRMERLAYAVYGAYPETLLQSGARDTFAGKRISRAKTDYANHIKFEAVKIALANQPGKNPNVVLAEEELSVKLERVKNLALPTIANLLLHADGYVFDADPKRDVEKRVAFKKTVNSIVVDAGAVPAKLNKAIEKAYVESAKTEE